MPPEDATLYFARNPAPQPIPGSIERRKGHRVRALGKIACEPMHTYRSARPDPRDTRWRELTTELGTQIAELRRQQPLVATALAALDAKLGLVRAELREVERPEFVGELQELEFSITGLAYRTAEPFPPGTRVRCSFECDGSGARFEAVAAVIHVTPEVGEVGSGGSETFKVALGFRHLDSETERRLAVETLRNSKNNR